MTLRIKLSHLAVGLVVGALLIGSGYALATTRNRVIHACINARTRALTVPVKGRCTHGLKALTWNQRGPRGARGARGARGSRGARGARGPAGTAGTPASVSVGSVTTEPPGSAATVTRTGTGSNAILNFGIPQGAAGVNASGTGVTAYGQVWMWTGLQAAALARGSDNVSVTGGDGAAVLFVSGCSTPGLQEPVITVTADHDPHDTNSGNNDSSSGAAVAYVTHWSLTGSTLAIDVSTYDPMGVATANSDFSFTVYC